MCRPCADQATIDKYSNIKKRGIRPGVFILINGECLNCKKHVDTQEEYAACEECHLKNIARLYLGTSRRWKELQTLWVNQHGICPYTGIRLGFGIDASLDHILPSSRFPELANEISNMEFIHNDVNLMKKDMTKEEFLELIQVISLNLNLTTDSADWWKK